MSRDQAGSAKKRLKNSMGVVVHRGYIDKVWSGWKWLEHSRELIKKMLDRWVGRWMDEWAMGRWKDGYLDG